MNISSALIKQCIVAGDFETWSYLRQEYLPVEYHTLYKSIDKHCETFHEFPSFDDLKLSIRHAPTRDKVFAIEAVDVDVDVDVDVVDDDDVDVMMMMTMMMMIMMMKVMVVMTCLMLCLVCVCVWVPSEARALLRENKNPT